MSDLNLNIPISKIDEEQRIIGGWATVEELDKQGEITDYQASKKAFSNWEGNIREMHDPLGVGDNNNSFRPYLQPVGKLYGGIENPYWVKRTEDFVNQSIKMPI